MSYEDEEGSDIDWENPFYEIRSSEINEIDVEFLDNGKKVVKTDEKGEEYTQYRFKCVRTDIENPAEIVYITSSKRLIEAVQGIAPIKGKTVKIEKTGSGFQTKYKITEL